MQFRLRTLVVLMLFGPPLLAGWIAIDRDPFQVFLVTGCIAYVVACIVVGRVIGSVACELQKLIWA